MNEALKQVLVQKMMVKHAIEQYRKMMEITGKDYEKQINILLDQLITLEKLEKELSKKK